MGMTLAGEVERVLEPWDESSGESWNEWFERSLELLGDADKQEKSKSELTLTTSGYKDAIEYVPPPIEKRAAAAMNRQRNELSRMHGARDDGRRLCPSCGTWVDETLIATHHAQSRCRACKKKYDKQIQNRKTNLRERLFKKRAKAAELADFAEYMSDASLYVSNHMNVGPGTHRAKGLAKTRRPTGGRRKLCVPDVAWDPHRRRVKRQAKGEESWKSLRRTRSDTMLALAHYLIGRFQGLESFVDNYMLVMESLRRSKYVAARCKAADMLIAILRMFDVYCPSQSIDPADEELHYNSKGELAGRCPHCNYLVQRELVRELPHPDIVCQDPTGEMLAEAQKMEEEEAERQLKLLEKNTKKQRTKRTKRAKRKPRKPRKPRKRTKRKAHQAHQKKSRRKG